MILQPRSPLPSLARNTFHVERLIHVTQIDVRKATWAPQTTKQKWELPKIVGWYPISDGQFEGPLKDTFGPLEESHSPAASKALW